MAFRVGCLNGQLVFWWGGGISYACPALLFCLPFFLLINFLLINQYIYMKREERGEKNYLDSLPYLYLFTW